MKSGNDKEAKPEEADQTPSRLLCSSQSSRLLLVILIAISLNIVACYDWILSRVLKVFGRKQQPAVSLPIQIDFGVRQSEPANQSKAA
jgi:hypothetical protein